MLLNRDRTSNTEIIGLQGSTESITIDRTQANRSIDRTQANRSIIPTGYKDTPQWRSINPQTL